MPKPSFFKYGAMAHDALWCNMMLHCDLNLASLYLYGVKTCSFIFDQWWNDMMSYGAQIANMYLYCIKICITK